MLEGPKLGRLGSCHDFSTSMGLAQSVFLEVPILGRVGVKRLRYRGHGIIIHPKCRFLLESEVLQSQKSTSQFPELGFPMK